jgi:membrane protein DedA with SNARE-associated domain
MGCDKRGRASGQGILTLEAKQWAQSIIFSYQHLPTGMECFWIIFVWTCALLALVGITWWVGRYYTNQRLRYPDRRIQELEAEVERQKKRRR